MIAKFTLSLIGLCSLVSVYGQSSTQSRINDYIQVANDYDIHPPKLEFGYPLWYELDTLAPRTIIFLKKGMEELIKLNDSAYVGSPSEENAEIMSLFTRDAPTLNYFIIPDSNLTYYKLRDFNLKLCSCTSSKLFFVGSNGLYTSYKMDAIDACNDMIYCFYPRNMLQIKMNQRNEFLIEGAFSRLDSIAPITFHHYWANFFGESDPSAFYYSLYDKEKIAYKVEQFNEALLEQEDDYFLREELSKWNRYGELVSKFGRLNRISNSVSIDVDIIGNEVSISRFYRILSEINKGLFRARSEYCKMRFEKDYLELFEDADLDQVLFCHIQLPDLVLYLHRASPPSIQEIQIIHPK